jgi:uncharacterized membrane protein (UPF0127 family)
VAEARSPWARTRGLLGRSGLEKRAGLWLPVRSVHTVGMRFPIDLVWLAADRTAIRVDRAVGPGRIRSCRTARGGVVETAAGQAVALARDLRRRADAAPPPP